MRGRSCVVAAIVGGALSACTLFTDLGGFAGGSSAPLPPDADGARDTGLTSGDAAEQPDAPIEAGPPIVARYERKLTVTNTAPTALPGGYAVCVSLPPAASSDLVAAGKVRDDWADLRLFGPDGEITRLLDDLPGGVERACFRLARAVPAGGVDDGYALRYGDPGATPPPLAIDIFDFYDGFDGASLSAKWLTTGAPVVAGGVLTLPKSTDSGITTTAASDGIPTDASLDVRVKVIDPNGAGEPQDGGGDFYYWFGFQHTGDFGAFEPWTVFIERSPGTIKAEHKTDTGTCQPGCESSTYPQSADFRTYRVDRVGSVARLTFDDGTKYVADGSNGDMSIMIRSYLTGSDVVVDWVRARPLVDPEPTVGIGPEQSL